MKAAIAIFGAALASAAMADDVAAPSVLVFHRCEGFAHTAAIEAANAAFRKATEDGLLKAEFSTDYEALRPESLGKYDALVLNNTTGLDTAGHPWMADGIAAFVESGKGYAVLHGGADCFADCPKLAEICGGLFAGHPWTSDGTWAFKVDDAEDPVNRAFKDTSRFRLSDEIYQHASPPFDPEKIHVLVSLDFDDPEVAGREGMIRPESTLYPVSWTKRCGKGRVFFTSFGHDERAWNDPVRRMHMMDGIMFAACGGRGCRRAGRGKGSCKKAE